MDTLLALLKEKKHVVLFAGSGISVAAGVPTFRSNDGLFRQAQERFKLKGHQAADVFDAVQITHDNALYKAFLAIVKDLYHLDTQPTAFHQLAGVLAREGRLRRMYTQNIDGIESVVDGLHTRTPLRQGEDGWPNTVQLHGDVHFLQCQSRDHVRRAHEEDFDSVEKLEMPLCDTCATPDPTRRSLRVPKSLPMRPYVLLYSDETTDEGDKALVMDEDQRSECDLLVVVGTTLTIQAQVSFLRGLARHMHSKSAGNKAVWLNLTPPPKSANIQWDLEVLRDCEGVAHAYHATNTCPPTAAPPPDTMAVCRRVAESGPEGVHQYLVSLQQHSGPRVYPSTISFSNAADKSQWPMTELPFRVTANRIFRQPITNDAQGSSAILLALVTTPPDRGPGKAKRTRGIRINDGISRIFASVANTMIVWDPYAKDLPANARAVHGVHGRMRQVFDEYKKRTKKEKAIYYGKTGEDVPEGASLSHCLAQLAEWAKPLDQHTNQMHEFTQGLRRLPM